MGQHRGDSGRRGVSKGPVIAVAAVVAVVVLVVGWIQLGDRIDREGADAAGTCVEGDAVVHVAADPSIAPVLTDLADRFSATEPIVRDHCITVEVTDPDPAAIVPALAAGAEWDDALGSRPDLWVPQSSSSLAEVGTGVVDGGARSLAASPIVLSVPPTLGNALEGAGTRWQDLSRLESTGLSSIGLPQWKSLGLTLSLAPGADASALALQAVAAGVAGHPGGPLTQADAESAAVRDAAATLGVAAEDGTEPTPAPPPATTHAVPVTEQTMYRTLAQDSPPDALAYRPAGPTPVADFPAAILTSADETRARAAAQFTEFLRTPEHSASFLDAGFRVPGGATPDSTVMPFPRIGETVAPADAAAVTTLLDAARNPERPRSTTILLDLSESMATREGGGTRLANVTRALTEQIAAAPDDAAIGLWEFAGRLDGTRPYRVAVPTAPLAEGRGGTSQRDALDDALAGAAPSTGSHSYATVDAAYRAAAESATPQRPASILLVTDGADDTPNLTRTQLFAALDAAEREDAPVTIDVVVLGDAEQSLATLRELAERTGGTLTELPSSNTPDLGSSLARFTS
nr:substrate-binding domain-containing protein [Rhodococcus sp. HNM0569]